MAFSRSYDLRGSCCEHQWEVVRSKLNGLATEQASLDSPAMPHFSHSGKNCSHPAEACPLKFTIECKCSNSCCSSVADAACWSSVSALCDDRRPGKREARGTHHSIASCWRPARALTQILGYFSSLLRLPASPAPTAVSHLRVFQGYLHCSLKALLSVKIL